MNVVLFYEFETLKIKGESVPEPKATVVSEAKRHRARANNRLPV